MTDSPGSVSACVCVRVVEELVPDEPSSLPEPGPPSRGRHAGEPKGQVQVRVPAWLLAQVFVLSHGACQSGEVGVAE